jgi:hypothetical protein
VSKRPPLWIHRTKRFWLGLLTALFVLAATVFAGYYSIRIVYDTHHSPRGHAWKSQAYMLGLEDGGILFRKGSYWRRSFSVTGGKAPHWHLESSQRYGFRYLPSIGREDQDDFVIFVPGMGLVLLICLLWLLYLFRTERKEQAFYESDD